MDLCIPILAAASTYVQAKMMQQPPNPAATEQELQAQQMTKSMALMMPLMMIMGTVGFMAGGGPGGKKVPEINADRKEYLRYLSGLRTRVTSSAAAQVTFFNYHAPHPEDLLSIIGTNRQWSRQVNHDFYAATRIGLGSEAAVDRLLKPAVGGA